MVQRRKEMAVKKETTTQKAPTTKKRVAKGDQYACEACGLVVTVDEACGCEETMIMCCDQPMKLKRAAVKKS